MPSTTVEKSLEEALQTWEDTRFVQECQFRILNRFGMPVQQDSLAKLSNWRNLRKTFMDNTIERLLFEDWYLQLQAEFEREWNFGGLNSLHMLPFEYFAWTRKSRRVFTLDADKQAQFQFASFPEWTWEEILWPFDSFGIELAHPITLPMGKNREFKCHHVLVSHVWIGTDYMICIRAFNGDGVPGLLKNKDRKRLIEAVKRNDFHTMYEVTEGAIERRAGKQWLCQGFPAFPIYVASKNRPKDLIDFDDDKLLTKLPANEATFGGMVNRAPPEVKEGLRRLMRIVLGACVHLDSISMKGPVRWEKRRSREIRAVGPLGIITDESLVCRILGRGSIDPNVFELPANWDPNSRMPARPHWRRRHRRKPPYSPKDHPRTIIIPPTFVNEALMPFFGVISGSITKILPEE